MQAKYPDLKNKTVLITGANGGIGRGLCRSFLAAECKIIALFRKEQAGFSISANDQERITFLCGDITQRSAVADWLGDMERQASRVDILVNNAGVHLDKPLLHCDENDWSQIMDTNLKATFFFSQLLARHMTRASSGAIVNITSFAADVPSVFGGLYAASKSALKTLTRCMAAEWAPAGIRVNALSPGVVETRMTAPAILQKRDKLKEAISMQRFAEVAEIANVALFLASDVSSYITGEVVNVTGGKWLVQDPERAWLAAKG